MRTPSNNTSPNQRAQSRREYAVWWFCRSRKARAVSQIRGLQWKGIYPSGRVRRQTPCGCSVDQPNSGSILINLLTVQISSPIILRVLQRKVNKKSQKSTKDMKNSRYLPEKWNKCYMIAIAPDFARKRGFARRGQASRSAQTARRNVNFFENLFGTAENRSIYAIIRLAYCDINRLRFVSCQQRQIGRFDFAFCLGSV